MNSRVAFEFFEIYKEETQLNTKKWTIALVSDRKRWIFKKNSIKGSNWRVGVWKRLRYDKCDFEVVSFYPYV